MATSTITPDENTIQTEVFIAAPPERVFQAISDPAQTRQWWGQKGMYRVTDTYSDVRPGGKWYSAGAGDDGKTFRVEGEYLEVDPPRLLVHTWIGSYSGGLKTTVYWELETHSVHDLHPSGPKKAGTGTGIEITRARVQLANDHQHLLEAQNALRAARLRLLRAIGLPARYVSGYLFPDPQAAPGSSAEGQSHAWAQYWANDWHGLDATNRVVPGVRHVVVGHGRDRRLRHRRE